jgi:hypothetical protein
VLDIYKAEGRPENEDFIYRIPLLVPKVTTIYALDSFPFVFASWEKMDFFFWFRFHNRQITRNAADLFFTLVNCLWKALRRILGLRIILTL